MVFQNQFDCEVHQRVQNGMLSSAFVVRDRDAAVAWERIRGFPNGQRDAYHEIYADTLKWVWRCVTIIVGVGLIASLFAKETNMNRDLGSKQGFVERAQRRRDAVTEV